ncbi:pollen receptor-like kinase 3 [Nicotiana tabacum]|uniref:Pollen receptor-like kinase 3 n=2 Tax=Nicotiana TaxID=4085 RepID=A0A1S3XWM9_TOBAC|nr:PREDICTED: probable inactive leucine-rich repeat receptor-like protein kinase At5g20690 [Nicotiana sylvestris]XP_016444346.1 PREDICTED: pollen receptor-like kinase 3 [Nicotiana tabacum]
MANIFHVMIKTCLICIVFLINYPMPSISVTHTEALLKLKQSFTNAESLDSWKPETDPCDKNSRWIGVICQNQIVRSVLLGRMNLSGNIDVDSLSQLSGLRTLSFRSNLFSGPIPEFNRMGALKGLYLSANQFSGEIPSNYFDKMQSLKKLWLSGNKFTGEIPSSILQLHHLIELHLENNQFSGPIPTLNQSTLLSLDLSNNNLKGEIPESLSRFNASSFKGNAEVCGEKLGKVCDQAPNNSNNNNTTNNKSHGNSNKSISIWVMIASIVLLLVMVVGIYFMCRRQQNRRAAIESFEEPSLGRRISSDSKKSFELSRRGSSIRKGSINGKRVGDLTMVNDDKGEFGLADLMKAAAEVLGNGPLGSSYKALMANGLTVVVKRIKEMNKIGKDGFDAEVRRLGRLRHKNILTLLAYHYRKEEKLFVYEYIPKGSLLFLLHGDRGIPHAELNWPVRLKIVQGIAQGLSYLHTELASDLPHGDLKSSNILINTDHEPILTGYGFYTLINNAHAAQALIAFKSPEAVQNHQVTPKSDVYCLGIVILEILTGKFPSQYLNTGKGGIDIVQWVKSAIAEGREAELYDPDIIASAKNSTSQMKELLHIGAACVESNPQQRINITEVIRRIEEIQQQTGQTIQIIPSLRDGCAEIPVS